MPTTTHHATRPASPRLIFSLAAVPLLLLVYAAAAQDRPGGMGGPPPVPKNLKVLKGVPASQIIPIMHE